MMMYFSPSHKVTLSTYAALPCPLPQGISANFCTCFSSMSRPTQHAINNTHNAHVFMVLAPSPFFTSKKPQSKGAYVLMVIAPHMCSWCLHLLHFFHVSDNLHLPHLVLSLAHLIMMSSTSSVHLPLSNKSFGVSCVGHLLAPSTLCPIEQSIILCELCWVPSCSKHFMSN